jgi:hypothetical protein
MKKLLWLRPVLLVCLALWFHGSARAAETRGQPAPTSHTPGLAAAQALSTITGVAISPLVGVSGVGVWKYFHTPLEKRPGLPWYAQPWFWGPALLLVTLAFVKDTFGTALPTAVKKPFDVAEAIENKISGLIAAGAFVPLIAIIFTEINGDTSALCGEADLAMVNLTPLLNVLTVPVAVVMFAVVWMVSHVINVLILISPFTTVDAALKSARLFLLTTVVGTAYVNPYVGAAWSFLIILVCFLLAGWAFRLMVFGAVFTWDLGTFRKSRFQVQPDANWMFTARALGRTPIRTYGQLRRGPQGELVLSYRPWLFLPRRTLTLPPGQYAAGRGLFYSEIVQLDADATPSVMTLPPRYRSHEEELSSIYRLAGVQDIGVVKGFKAFWGWLKGLFGWKRATA